MTGLFYKDWLCFLRNDLKGLLFSVLILTFSSSGSRFTLMFSVLPMLFLWIGLDTLICDDKSGWDVYARALPTTARRIVLEKYVFVYGLFAAGMALAFLLSAVTGAAGAKSDLQIFFFAGVSLVVTAVLFPLFYRMNAHAVISAAMTLCLAVVLFTTIYFMKNAAMLETLAASPAVSILKRWLVPAGLLLLAGSYFVSLRVYKDWGEGRRKA